MLGKLSRMTLLIT